MDYLHSRVNVLNPGKGRGKDGSDYESTFPDLLLESGPTVDGCFISFTIFNSKDGSKTPMGELSNIICNDSKSLKISIYDLPSLYLLRLHLNNAIALGEKLSMESALKQTPKKS